MRISNFTKLSVAIILLAIVPISSLARVEFSAVTLSNQQSRSAISGYRVCVYSGTDQNARSKANSAIASVNKNFEDMPVKAIYNAPIWKVHVGYCLNKTEATILLERIRAFFPSAYIVSEKINVSAFTSDPSFTLSSVDSLSVDLVDVGSIDSLIVVQ